MPPRQRVLPIFPEPDQHGRVEAELRPIARPKTLREVARFGHGEPVLIRMDAIRAAYANCGLTHQQIGELINVSRYTVAAALRVDPSTNLYTFCEVMNVIGVEMAELFPKRKRNLPDRKPDVKWSRGPFLAENARKLIQEMEEKEAVNSRPRGRRRK